MKYKKEIDAVHKHDIKILLQNLGLLDDFISKKIKCQFCTDTIKEDNFGAVYVKEDNILFSCSKIECLSKLPKK